MKTVTFLVNSTPERPALGYGDYVIVESDEALLFGSHASTCPNPYRLNDHGSAVLWKVIYDWIAEGEYQWQCIQHDKYGKCLLINGGGEVGSSGMTLTTCKTVKPQVDAQGYKGRYFDFIRRGFELEMVN